MTRWRLGKRHSRSILAAFSCLLFLVGIGPDLILCFGHDGHVALEIASAEKGCATAPPSAPSSGDHLAANPPPPVESTSCCGSCLDIPLAASTPAALARTDGKRQTPEYPSPVPFLIAKRGRSDQDTVRHLLLAALPGPPTSVTESLRSTVLRI